MSEYLILGKTLEEIADAIREKTGGTDEMFPADMAGAIRGIQSVGLPDGLPDGVSALASGTYTPTTDAKDVTIVHSLGVAPNFYIIAMETKISTSVLESTIVVGGGIGKNMKKDSTSGTIYTVTGYCAGYNASSSEMSTTFTQITNKTFTSTDFTVMVSGGLTLKAGHTYRWVCGVLDGIL